MSTTPVPLRPPPLPAQLRERFRDHPSHIVELERVLTDFQIDEYKALDPFERVLWALESALDRFASDARARCREAEAHGSADALARANDELLYMLHSRNPITYDLSELQTYVDLYKKTCR